MDIPRSVEQKVLRVDKPLTANVLSGALRGKIDKAEEERTIVLTLLPGKRPEVSFTGFWNGRFIRAAMDSIAKAYRLRRHSVSRPIIKVEKGAVR